MPSSPPIQIADAGASPTTTSFLRPNSAGSEASQYNRPTLYRYNGALYQVANDPYGDEGNPLSPNYFRNCQSVFKSTTGGNAWTEQDNANRLVAGQTLVGAFGAAVVQCGSVLWFLYDQGQRPETSPGSGSYITQWDEIRACKFDMATGLWGTPITTGGPRRSYADGALATSQPFVWDAAWNGADEILCVHLDTDPANSPQEVHFSVFDISSETWTTVDSIAHVPAGSADELPDRVIHDGTYWLVMNWPAVGTVSGGSSYERASLTIDASYALGTVANMFANYGVGQPSLASNPQQNPLDVIVFGGEVIAVQVASLKNYLGADPKIMAMRTAAGSATPSWAWDDLDSVAWDATTDSTGQSGHPVLAESGGTLYCLAGGHVFSIGPNPPQNEYWVYAQAYAGSGTWGAPAIWWRYRDAYPSGGSSFTNQQNQLYKLAALGNNGESGAAGVNIAASMYDYWESNSIYFFGAVPNTCCCSDIAY